MGVIVNKIGWILRFCAFYIVPKALKYEVHLETTNFCNAKCTFCPNSTLKRSKMFMSDETFELVLDRLKSEKIRVSEFILHLNGEPLTDKKLFDRIACLHKNFENAKIRFTSNFALADENVRKNILSSPIDQITISLNSIDPEEYKKIMGGLLYEKTISNVQSFIKEKEKCGSNIKILFSIVVRPENKDSLEEFKKMYSPYGEVRLIKMGNWVGDDSNGVKKKKRKRICLFIYKTISVLSNGDYALCCFDAEGIIHKNINDTKIFDAYKGYKYQSIRKYHIKKGISNRECEGCSFY